MFVMTEEDKKYFASLMKRLDCAFLEMQYEYSKDVLKAALNNLEVITPDEIDEKVRFCMKFEGRSGGKRLFYTRLLVLAEIQRNREGGKLWPFIVIKRSTK